MTAQKSPVDALIILDGWGINTKTEGNAVSLADTPFLDGVEISYPSTRLDCSGNAVGLPQGIMGNSEVGHMNIGAGRKVFQDLVRIDKAIQDRSLFQNSELVKAMDTVKARGTALHLMGLLSDGGVHSHSSHLLALIDMATDRGITRLYIHPILDGRDTPPKSGVTYIRNLQSYLADKGNGAIATLCGRFYAMDRDTRWDRVKKAYDLYTQAMGQHKTDPEAAMLEAYDSGQTDEFITPVTITEANGTPGTRIETGDAVIFFNFRADRAREITRAFTDPGFTGFDRSTVPDLSTFLCMTLYDESFTLPLAFAPVHLDRILGQIISEQGLKQLRIAETEKYAHVTYFFNGGDETVFPGEDRILIPSPREIATYDLKPEMSAIEVAQTACEKILSGEYRFVVLNFANMDMVGHTGVLRAGIKACETVDRCAKQVAEAIWSTGGTAMITADHGNAEQMMEPDGSPHTAHTLNQVRFILAGDRFKGQVLKPGILGDIAPTVLKVMGLAQPEEMTGSPLF